MVAVILAGRSSTAAFAEGIDLEDGQGNIVHGTDVAGQILMTCLLENQPGWAQWLEDPANANAASSLRVALSASMRQELGALSPILTALELVRQPSSSHDRAIDIRGQKLAAVAVAS